MKILIADNEPIILKTLSYYLSRAGYDICTANDGKLAISTFRQEKPNLVITDLMMPAANGAEVISYIRNTEQSSVPIVVLTSIGLKDTINNALKLGANDFITKPLKLDDVLKCVSQLIHSAKSRKNYMLQ